MLHIHISFLGRKLYNNGWRQAKAKKIPSIMS